MSVIIITPKAKLRTILLNVNGNLTFNGPTQIQLSSNIFTKAGTYTIITYTGALAGFNNITVLPPSGFTVEEVIDASANKAIKVRIA